MVKWVVTFSMVSKLLSKKIPILEQKRFLSGTKIKLTTSNNYYRLQYIFWSYF